VQSRVLGTGSQDKPCEVDDVIISVCEI